MSVQASFTARRGDFTLTFDAVLDPDSVVAVLGPNGSGKTTLLRTIAGLHGIDSGAITIDGQVVDDATAGVAPQDRSVGVVFQDYSLFPHLTVLENVAFGPRSRGMKRAGARARAREELDRLNVADLAERKPGPLPPILPSCCSTSRRPPSTSRRAMRSVRNSTPSCPLSGASW